MALVPIITTAGQRPTPADKSKVPLNLSEAGKRNPSTAGTDADTGIDVAT